MAVTTSRRQAKDPEGRMPLKQHLIELRNRATIAILAILAGTIVGWFFYEPVMQNLIIEPVQRLSPEGHPVRFNNQAVADAFTIKVRVSVYLGLIMASPVWLYQIWGFITPGLTRKERRYSIAFIAAAVPLFLAGVVLAVWLFPKAISFGADFSLQGTENLIPLDYVITFAIRLIIALGVAFLLPLFLIALNMAGLLPGRTMGKHWRIAVFIAFLFAAIVSPSPDPTQMLIMALPLILLYCVSVGFGLLNDRRRRRRAEAELAALGDDEATPLSDLIGPDDPIDAPSSLDEPDDPDGSRR